MPTVRKTAATLNVQLFRNIKIGDPHLLTLLTYLQTRHSIKPNDLQKIKLPSATKLMGLLKNKIKSEERSPLSLSDSMEPNDIIIFISPADFPMYSVMIHEVGKNDAQIVELEHPRGIKFSKLSKVLNEKKLFKPYLFKAMDVDEVLRRNFPNIKLKPKYLLMDFVNSAAKKLEASHQATAFIFLYAKDKEFKLLRPETSVLFLKYLEELRPEKPYQHGREVLALELYDVIGMFSDDGRIVHAATVIDTRPVTLVDFDVRSRKMVENTVKNFLDERGTLVPYLFRFQDIRGKITLPYSPA